LCGNYRLDVEITKKEFKYKYDSYTRLLNIAVCQDILKLERDMDYLRIKLRAVNTVFEKKDVKESSKCWSEMLSETKKFMDFLLNSFHDISKIVSHLHVLYVSSANSEIL